MDFIIFNIVVIGLLLFDLLVLHKHQKTISVKSALLQTAFWVSLAAAFGVWIYVDRGSQDALAFFTGYLIEESLSVDNLFVFILIFSFFKIPQDLQHRVLFWGIFGALIFRAFFILVGIELIQHFHFLLYAMGAFVIVAGIRIFFQKEENEMDIKETFLFKILKKIIPTTDTIEGEKFFVLENGKRLATPLFLALILIEISDVVFALDSIPAVLSISQDPFIVYTSNIFAILGLRALYFALAGVMQLFHYLKFGLAIILIFIGIKIITAEFYQIDILWALLFVAVVLVGSIVLSILKNKAAFFGKGKK